MYRICKILYIRCIEMYPIKMLVKPLQEDEDLVEYTSVEKSQVFNSNGMWSDVTLASHYVARYKIFVDVLEKFFT